MEMTTTINTPINSMLEEINKANLVSTFEDCEYRLPCGWCIALDKECGRLCQISTNFKGKC